MKLTLNICHLYPDLMDTYGDKGNITAIIKRCQWRNINTSLTPISLGDTLDPEKYDIYFFGGGQDNNQIIVGRDLQSKASKIKKAVSSGSVLLSICGGYQLLQNYFKTNTGVKIPGIGLFNAYTQASNDRMIQNLLIKINPDLGAQITSCYSSIVDRRLSIDELIGFENHSGKTYLGQNLQPLGTVIIGSGNNDEDKTEGAIYKNAFGCYLHGSLLPKNPHFADYLIAKALEQRYGIVKLEPLDDSVEWQAHIQASKRARTKA